MPLIGSTITDLDQLKHYSSDSAITTQKNLWGDGTSLVVLDSWLSRGLYAIRARLKPGKTQEENLAALEKVKELITNEYQNYQCMGYEENFAVSVSDKAFPKSLDSGAQQEKSSLTVKSLSSRVNGAFLTARAEAEEKKCDEIIQKFPDSDKELARIFYNSLFKRPSGYRMPDDYQEKEHAALVGQTLDFATKNKLKLSDLTHSIQHHVDVYLTPQYREINSTILCGILKREEITREDPDYEWAKDIYDEMFLKLDGTYKQLTQEDCGAYKTKVEEEKTVSGTLFQERLAAIGQSNNPREFLNLLTEISSLPSQEEKIRLQTKLLNTVGIFETDPHPQSPKSVTVSIAEEKTRLPLCPETSIFTLVQSFVENCAQINSTPKEFLPFDAVCKKLISNQEKAQKSLCSDKELDEKVKTILEAIIAYKLPPGDYMIGTVLKNGTTLL